MEPETRLMVAGVAGWAIILCAVCIANAHHKCGSSRKGLTFMCNTCMNDWSEYCDDKQDHGASLSMNVWQEWFRDFRDLALRNLETAQ